MNQFAVSTVIADEDIVKPAYDHGFTTEQVARIKADKEAISARDLSANPVTLDEFKETIVPWCRIHRVESFILNPVKVPAKKTRAIRATKPKVARIPKPKKLTKKAIETMIGDIIFKQAMGEDVSEEEQAFLLEHTKGLEL